MLSYPGDFAESAPKRSGGSPGGWVVICKDNQPVAELRAIEPARITTRDLTPMYPGKTFRRPDFFDPLSADEIAAWEGTQLPGLKGRGTARNRYNESQPAENAQGPHVKLLVDTCVLLWLITGERKLPARVSSSLAHAELWLSAASDWKLAVKFSKGSISRADDVVSATKPRQAQGGRR